MASSLLTTNLPDLTLASRGKVRDIYTTSSEDHLLFVATDRISVYDVILKNVRDSLPAIVRQPTQRSTCSVGRSRKGEAADGHILVLVSKAPTYRPESPHHSRHRRDAGRSEEIQGPARGTHNAREESKSHPHRSHCQRIPHWCDAFSVLVCTLHLTVL